MSVCVTVTDNVLAVGETVHKKVIPKDSVIACCTVSLVKNLRTEAGVILEHKVAEEADVIRVINNIGVSVGVEPVAGVVDVRKTAVFFNKLKSLLKTSFIFSTCKAAACCAGKEIAVDVVLCK